MFKDREEAGKRLTLRLKEELSLHALNNALILAIPRGGIVVGKQLAQVLKTPMDCLVTKKIPAPGNEELAIGAVADGGTVIWEEDLIKRLGVTNEYKEEMVKKKVCELETKRDFFRKGKGALDIRGKTIILVDDGVATGATIKAAIEVVRSFSPKEIIVAVPVISRDSLTELKSRAEKIIYLEAPEMFFSVGQFYENFSQISDEELKNLI